MSENYNGPSRPPRPLSPRVTLRTPIVLDIPDSSVSITVPSSSRCYPDEPLGSAKRKFAEGRRIPQRYDPSKFHPIHLRGDEGEEEIRQIKFNEAKNNLRSPTWLDNEIAEVEEAIKEYCEDRDETEIALGIGEIDTALRKMYELSETDGKPDRIELWGEHYYNYLNNKKNEAQRVRKAAEQCYEDVLTRFTNAKNNYQDLKFVCGDSLLPNRTQRPFIHGNDHAISERSAYLTADYYGLDHRYASRKHLAKVVRSLNLPPGHPTEDVVRAVATARLSTNRQDAPSSYHAASDALLPLASYWGDMEAQEKALARIKKEEEAKSTREAAAAKKKRMHLWQK